MADEYLTFISSTVNGFWIFLTNLLFKVFVNLVLVKGTRMLLSNFYVYIRIYVYTYIRMCVYVCVSLYDVNACLYMCQCFR